ncbi:MAG: phosphoribosylglycinamide formyltransferase [Thermoplasmata archaeon]|nr:phosphoribosylglycinamide formyltransferase [Thermoplasmata archaeon]
MARPLAVAVLVSGQGSLLEPLSESSRSGTIAFRIALVVSDRAGTPAIERARRAGLPTEVLPRAGADDARWSRSLDFLLRSRGVDLVLLAGFLSVLPPGFLAGWRGRVINVHPSLLPRHGGPGMFGLRVHAAVLASGEATTGATVHLVTDTVDGGPALAHRELPVETGDTPERLRDRLRPLELEALFEVLGQFATGRWALPYAG